MGSTLSQISTSCMDVASWLGISNGLSSVYVFCNLSPMPYEGGLPSESEYELGMTLCLEALTIFIDSVTLDNSSFRSSTMV